MPFGGFSVGSLVADLGFNVDDDGAVKFDRMLRGIKQDVAKPITAELKGDYDGRALDAYERKLKDVRDMAKRKQDFKAQLGADFDNRAFREYERSLANADKQVDRSIKAQGRLRTAFGNIYGNGGALFAAAGGLYGLQAAGKAVISTASDINESITKNRVLFGDYAKDIERFAATSADSFGISKKAALEYTGVFGNLSRAIGISRKDSAEMSVRLTKLAADLASFNNSSIDEALDALRSGLVGETEPLRRFGVTLSANAVAAEAMRAGIVKVKKETYEYRAAALAVEKAQAAQTEAIKKNGKDSLEAREATLALEKANKALTETAKGGKVELTAQQKALATTALVFRQTKNAQGDFTRTSEGAANQTRILQARISDIGAEIGAKLLPVVQDAVLWVNRMIDEWKAGTGDGGRLRDTVKDIGEKLKDTGEFIKDHIDLIKVAAGAWLAYKVQAKAAAAVSGVSALLGGGRRGKGSKSTDVATGAAGGLLAGIPGPVKVAALIAGGIAVGMNEAQNRQQDAGNKRLEEFNERIKDIIATSANAGEAQARLAKLRDVNKSLIDMNPGKPEKWKKYYGEMADAAEDARKAVANKALRRDIKEVTDNVLSNWRDLRHGTKTTMKDIRENVASNSRMIRNRLDVDSKEGQEALSRNFRQARRSVREAMKDGTISTRDGLREIRRLMVEELKNFGITPGNALSIAKHGDIKGQAGLTPGPAGRQRGGWIRRAAGGWIGGRGMVSDDVVPIAPGVLAAYGEFDAAGPGGRRAVINRHQAPVVEAALAMGGYPGLDHLPRGNQLPVIENALGPGGLDALFGMIRRPHMLAGGGRIVPVPGFPGEQAASSVLGKIAWVARTFGLTLTDAYGQGHKSPGHTKYGTAADFAGSDAAMDKAVAALVRAGYLVGYDGRFGSQAWPGHGPSSVAGGNAHLHVEFGGKGGNLGAGLIGSVRAPRVKGGGAVGMIAQRALDMGAAGASKLMQRAAGSAVTAPVAGGGGGGWSKGRLAKLWSAAGGNPQMSNLMAAIALAESGGRAGIVNSIGAGGLWQIHPPEPGYLNPMTNAQIAVRKLADQGLGAWEAYTNGNYRQFLQGGGRFGFSQSQARNQAAAGESLARAKGKFRAKQHTGVGVYDRIMGNIDDLRRRYEQTDRRYNQTDEQLLNEDGTVNTEAVNQRAAELQKLKELRERIRDKLKQAQKVAERVVKNLRGLIRNYTRSLKHAPGKDRSGIRDKIRDAQGQLEEFTGITHDLPFDITDANLDITDIVNERAAVLGTEAEQSTTDVTPDAQAQIDRANEIAARATERAEISERSLRVLGSPGGLNPGGIGMAPTITIQTLHPADPATLTAIARAANAGNSYGGNVQSPRDVIGV